MVSFLICLALLIGGYFVYGKVVENTFGPDDRETPAVKINDGVDYVVLPQWKLFMIQLLNIAGLGPIFGAMQGALWGPIVFLWITFGTIFAGAVHDYFSGMMSERNNGASISEISGIYLGGFMKNVMRVFSVVLLIMVGTVFAVGPAGLKWNMGWMNDVCHYLKMDPWFRQFHHKDVTFSMMYAFSERFVLPLSHDEVVYMKGSLRGKMPGDDWRQLAGVRGFTAYMLAHPGKKLTFMGAELGQWHEWDFLGQLDWYLLDRDDCSRTHACIQALNRFYKKSRPLWENDRDWNGFEWLVADDNHNNVLAFLRRDNKGHELICVVNFSPEAHEGYRFGVPGKLFYEEVFNTDDAAWGGSGVCNTGPIPVEDIPSHGRDKSIALRVPPLGAVFLQGRVRRRSNKA